MLKFALLGFLNYRPSSGYDLKQLMDVSTSNFWHAKQSQIYTTLKAMEKDGCVASHIEPQEGRPDRRVYEITEVGRTELMNWLEQPLTEIEPRKETLLLKLFYSSQIDPAIVLTQLRLQKKLHHAELERYKTIIKDVIQQFSASEGMQGEARFWEATRCFGERYEEMFISWLEDTIAEIEKESL